MFLYREMNAKPSFLCLLFFIIILCSSSTLVRSQDSCTSNELNPRFILFDTSSLRCVPIWEAQNFILRYAQASPNLWSFVLSFPISIYSYGAIGFSKEGNMVGSSAMVAWIESPGIGGMKEYNLGSTDPDQVIPDKGEVQWTNATYFSTPTSIVFVAFQLQTSEPSPHLIFAVGPKNSFPSGPRFHLSKHSDKISIEMDYASGRARASSTTLRLKRSHGGLNMGGWSVAMIIGAIIARHCKQWDPFWFYVHSSIQTLGFLGGVVGIILGLALSKQVSSNVYHHKNIGVLILVLGFLQVMAFVLRPGKESKMRKYWNYYHHNVGRILIIFAFINTLIGLHLGGEGSKWLAGYGITVAILVIVAIALEITMRIKSKTQLPN